MLRLLRRNGPDRRAQRSLIAQSARLQCATHPSAAHGTRSTLPDAMCMAHFPNPRARALCPSLSFGSYHHFCLSCYEEWARRQSSCPTCRSPVWAITVDLEYASLCGAEITQKAMTVMDEVHSTAEMPLGLRVPVRIEWPAGLVLKNTYLGDGVLVLQVVRGNGAHHSGVRAGDVILAVDGIPVRDHASAVELIEQRSRIGDCVLDVRKSDAVRQLQPHELFQRSPERSTGRSRARSRRGSPLARSSWRSSPQLSEDELASSEELDGSEAMHDSHA